MKSLVISQVGSSEWKEGEGIHPGSGEVVSRVLYTATCPHWDIHMFRGKPMFPGMELVYPIRAGRPGHEAVGEVVALGEGVTNFKVGDRVATWRDEGFGKNGTYAELMIQDAANLLAVPPDRDPLDYTSLELAMCVGASFLDIQKYSTFKDKRVFVQGLGPAGLIAVQIARALGSREVVALDINASRFALAKSLGADACFSPNDPAISGLTRSDKNAPDMVVECVGLAKSVNAALRMTKEIVALFGVQREDYIYPV
ncbi:MAG: zinc-binding dehydrogenase, partial [Spirochaetia bacterium]|nr:zinc-binding dehydrogenase [Spirochaetia bacterium]